MSETLVTRWIKNFFRKTTAGNGEGVKIVFERGFMGERVDAKGEAGDDADWVAAEAADQLLDDLFAVGGVLARADDGEQGEVGGR